MMALGVRFGDEVEFVASGDDAEAALDALAARVAEGEGEALVAVVAAAMEPPAPQPASPLSALGGVPAAPGLAIGAAVRLIEPEVAVVEVAGAPEAEHASLAAALEAVRAALTQRLAAETDQRREIVEAHLASPGRSRTAAERGRRHRRRQERRRGVGLCHRRLCRPAARRRRRADDGAGRRPDRPQAPGAAAAVRRGRAGAEPARQRHHPRRRPAAVAAAGAGSEPGGGPGDQPGRTDVACRHPGRVDEHSGGGGAGSARALGRGRRPVDPRRRRRPAAGGAQARRDRRRPDPASPSAARAGPRPGPAPPSLAAPPMACGSRCSPTSRLSRRPRSRSTMAQRAAACCAPSSCSWNATRRPSEDEQAAAYQAIADALGGRPLIIRTLDIGATSRRPTWRCRRRTIRRWACAACASAWRFRSCYARSCAPSCGCAPLARSR